MSAEGQDAGQDAGVERAREAPMWSAGSGGAGRAGGSRDGGRRRRGGGRGEDLAVPPADFRSYYGRPVLKPPVWKWDIAAYLFTGGLSAGSSLLAAGAARSGREDLGRAGRWGAFTGILASTFFLIHDLGRPERFHHMLRVAKPTSPMSMGTWILAAYGPAAGLAAAADLGRLLPRRGPLGLVRRLVPVAGGLGTWGAAATAPALASYTAVLLADTATPAWHEAHRDLPFVFTGSALASGAGVGLLGAPVDQTGPARRMAVAGAALELAATHRLEHGLGLASEAFAEEEPARLLRAARGLTVAGAAGAVLGRRSRTVSALSGLALLAGSALTRFGVYEAGVRSAKDPRYTVVPQRERLDAGS